MHDRDGVLLVRAAPEHHRPKAQRADLDAGATEVAVLHWRVTAPAIPARLYLLPRKSPFPIGTPLWRRIAYAVV